MGRRRAKTAHVRPPKNVAGEPRSHWGISETNLLVLLISLVFSLMITPVLDHYFAHCALVYASVTMVLLSGIFMNRARRWLFIPGILFVILTISVTWSTMVVSHPAMFVGSCILEAIVYGTIAILLLTDILKRHLATVASVFGAVCVYLLVGLAFAQLYWATERIEDESLSYAHPVATVENSDGKAVDKLDGKAAEKSDGNKIVPYSQMVYFSFVTMSTLGYGDIHPITPMAQTLAWMQSVIGQFYLAALVAWLISAIPRRANTANLCDD